MLTRQEYGGITWIDVVSPTHEEIRSLMDEFAVDPFIADALMTPSLRNRVDARDEYFYVVLHFPTFKHLHNIASVPLEIDFIVGKKWIITTRYVEIDPLHQFSKLFEIGSLLDRKSILEHAGFVFYYMLIELYKILNDELMHVEVRLDAVEERIFEGYEKEMVHDLSRISRDLLNYTQALETHDTMLQSLEIPGVALFGYEYTRNIRNLNGEYMRLASAVKSHRASLAELRETNNSLLNTKQNETMKIFTIMAFVTFPLSLLAAVFGMNTIYTPIVGHKWDFWIIVGIMAAGAISFFAIFKYKRWL